MMKIPWPVFYLTPSSPPCQYFQLNTFYGKQLGGICAPSSHTDEIGTKKRQSHFRPCLSANNQCMCFIISSTFS
jgi:hypothetical protein